MPEVIVKPDGTKEITYNDNRRIKIAPNVDTLIYKCPHSFCKAEYFTQDDLNQHRFTDHAELPKSLINIETKNKSKYFSKREMQKMNASFQREHLKHILLILGIDIKKTGMPIFGRLKAWLDARRNKT
jgi:hypothetical protein